MFWQSIIFFSTRGKKSIFFYIWSLYSSSQNWYFTTKFILSIFIYIIIIFFKFLYIIYILYNFTDK